MSESRRTWQRRTTSSTRQSFQRVAPSRRGMPAVPSSDEYDDPSFEITEDILASLKDVEDRYTLSLSQVPANESTASTSAPVRQPPAKKFKPNGWRPIIEEDEPPDIVVLDEKGTYGVVPKPPAVAAAPPSSAASRPPPPMRRVSGGFSGAPTRPVPPPVRPPARPPLPSRSSSGGIQQTVPARPSPLAQSTVPAPPHSSPSVTPAPQPGPSRPTTTTNPTGGDDNLAALLAQVEKLKADNERLQAAQRAAEEAQYAKAGEAANIRRAMERQTNQSAEELARMKAKMEELSTAKQRMEKELRNEMERLKTNLTFRAHELETSIRKPTWSVKKKPPLPANSQLHVPPSSFAVGQTPSRLPRNLSSQARPTARVLPPSSPDAPPTVKAPKSGKTFAAFHNSFAPTRPEGTSKLRSSPVRDRSSPLKGKGKGKEREIEREESGWGGGREEPFVAATQAGESQETEDGDVSMDMDMGTGIAESGGGGVETMMDGSGESGEADMEVEVEQEDETQEEEEEEEEEPFFVPGGAPLDWREELNHLVFSHRSLLISPLDPSGPPSLTLQVLLTAPLASPSALYTSACSDILSAFGHDRVGVGGGGWEEEIRGVLRGLIRMASVFCESAVQGAKNGLPPLIATLDLLSSLLVSLPPLSRAFVLSYTLSESDEQPLLLSVLCQVVRSLLQPGDGEEKEGLGESVMGVLEAVVWGVSEEDVPKLGILPRAQGFLATLLDKKQAPWLVEKSTRLLCLLSTHCALFRPLLSFPDDAPAEKDNGKGKGKENDYTRIPLIDLLCALLVSSPVGASLSEAHATRQSAVATLTLLSIAHADAPSLLIESREVVPSVVKCLLKETTVIWDEEDVLLDHPESHELILHTAHLALTLLYHLAGFTHLRLKLQQAARYHNGLAHAFVLAIGRISYADAPDCLDKVGRERVESMREQARDLIESVVEGPEGDLIWAAYQDAGEESGTELEGEADGEGGEDEEAVAAEVGMSVEDEPMEV